MKHRQFNDGLLESAWREVKDEFQASGFISPAPGFGTRFRARLEIQRIADEQKQAWLIVAINIVIALGFLVLIGLQFIPSLPSSGSFLSFWVEMFSNVVIFLKMIGTIFETLFRTLPGLIPPSWWLNVFISIGVLLLLWVSLMRQFVQKQGVMV